MNCQVDQRGNLISLIVMSYSDEERKFIRQLDHGNTISVELKSKDLPLELKPSKKVKRKGKKEVGRPDKKCIIDEYQDIFRKGLEAGVQIDGAELVEAITLLKYIKRKIKPLSNVSNPGISEKIKKFCKKYGY